MYDSFKRHVLVGRDLKEFYSLMCEQKFFEAAKWVQAIYEFPTVEATEKLAKEFEDLEKNYD